MRYLRSVDPVRCLAVLLGLAGCLLLRPAAAQSAPVGEDPARTAAEQGKKKPPRVGVSVVVGQGNVTRPNTLVPVKVTLQNNGDPFDGRLEIRSTGRVTRSPISLPRGANKTYTLYAEFVQPDSGPDIGTVSVLEGRKELAREPLSPQFEADKPILLTCTGDGANLKFLNGEKQVADAKPPAPMLVSSVMPAEMPRQWPGYEPANVVVVNGRAWSEMDDEQRRALRLWVGRGGRAILCGESSTEWRDAEAQSLVGVVPNRPLSVRTLACVAPWGGQSFRTQAGSLLTVDGPLQPGSEVLFAEGSRPLIVQRDVLQGKVFWLGFDPFRETVRNWDGAEPFWRKAIDRVRTSRNQDDWQGLAGIPDAMTAARALPRLPAPPLAAIIAFGVVYAVIFGPVNIAVLRRLRRTVRAWLFVPALALGMTLVVLFAGQSWGNARTVLNSLTVLNGYNGGSTAWEQTMTGVFSPTNRSFDLSVEDAAPLITDLGAGSSELDGAGQVQFGWPDDQGDGVAEWHQVALQLFATRVLEHSRPRDLGGAMRIALDPDGSGSVTNGTLLPAQSAYLQRKGQYCWIGKLDAGATVQIRKADWKKKLTGELSRPAPATQLYENQVFRENFERLWRGADDLLLSQSVRKETWLVAEVTDPHGGLRVADVPNNNRAALLLVRAFGTRQGAAGRGGN